MTLSLIFNQPRARPTVPLVYGSGGGPTMAVELWRYQIDSTGFHQLEDVSEILTDGSVDMNVDRAIKLASNLNVSDPSAIDVNHDYLAPYIRLTYPDARPDVYRQLGLYQVSIPQGGYTTKRAEVQFVGGDLTQVLASRFYRDTNTVTAGTHYRTELINTLQAAGIYLSNLPPSTRAYSATITYPLGTSYLDKVNAICDALGWYQMGADLNGPPSTPGPSRSISDVTPYRTLTDTDLMSPLNVKPSGDPWWNVVTCYTEDPAAPGLVATASNDDPADNRSTVNAGVRTRPPVKIDGNDITQSDLNAKAASYLSESLSYYRTADCTILPDLDALIPHQTVRLQLTGKQAGLSGLWWLRTSKIGFKSGSAAVALELNQLTSDINGVVA